MMNESISRDLLQKTWKRGLFFKIALCCIAIFFFCSFVTLFPTSSGANQPDSTSVNIISELRNLKAATMMYRMDHPDALSSLSENENHLALLLTYFDNPESYLGKHGFYAYRIVNGVEWAGCDLVSRTSEFPDSILEMVAKFWHDFVNGAPETLEKLEGKAQSTGLYGSSSIDEPPASYDMGHLYKKDAKAVWMLIRP